MICIGCGCDEHHACTLPGGAPCAWTHIGARGLAGICSGCVEMYPISIREAEVEIAESAIAAAIDDDDQTGEFESPSIFEAPTPRDFDVPTLSFTESARRLILPGDEEFHL